MSAEPNGAYGPVPRKEDARFIRGQGTFVDDIQLPGMLHGAILRSPLPHARIVSIDTAAAQAHPRVEAVITGETLAERGLAWMPTLSQDVQAVLATDKVRFQGQEVAFVVAKDRYSARDALELIDVEYEPLPAVVDAERALDPGAPVIRDDLPGKAGQPHLRLGGRRQGGDRRGLRRRGRGGRPGHALPAVASGPAGDLRRGGRHGPGQRPADGLVHDPGPARAPHPVRAGHRAARAQDPGRLAGHRRRVRQQGADLPRLPVRDRRLDDHRPAGQVGGGPVGEPDVHRVRPRLPHARRDRRHRGRQDPRPARPGARRPRRVQRDRPADQVPGRVLPHLHRLLRPAGGALRGDRRVHEQGARRGRLLLLVPHHRGGVPGRADGRPAGRASSAWTRPSCGCRTCCGPSSSPTPARPAGSTTPATTRGRCGWPWTWPATTSCAASRPASASAASTWASGSASSPRGSAPGRASTWTSSAWAWPTAPTCGCTRPARPCSASPADPGPGPRDHVRPDRRARAGPVAGRRRGGARRHRPDAVRPGHLRVPVHAGVRRGGGRGRAQGARAGQDRRRGDARGRTRRPGVGRRQLAGPR